jgi:signal transduction histidine kinase
LATKSAPEAAEANRLLTMVEEAIELTRILARGLHPMDVQTGLLTDIFQELAMSKSKRFDLSCQFECSQTVSLQDMIVANHLYRIAEEAVTNAALHGKAQHINICLDSESSETVLTITDDGAGLPDNARNGEGMGLRLMAYRAEIIGAAFHIERLAQGTRVICTLPKRDALIKNDVEKN